MFFRRAPKKDTTPGDARLRSLQDIFAPIPVADVSESTWNEWEDSVAFQNSHSDATEPPLPAPGQTQERPRTSATEAFADPFSSVTPKGN